MRRAIMLVAAATAFAAAFSAVPAAAQLGAAPKAPRTMDGIALVERESWRKEMTRRKQMMNDPVRKERAARAVALINAGDCAGALQLAINEQDTDMAATIRKACQAPAAQ